MRPCAENQRMSGVSSAGVQRAANAYPIWNLVGDVRSV